MDDGVAVGVPHAVVEVVLRALGREDDCEERGGNGLDDAEEEGRAPFLPTAERED